MFNRRDLLKIFGFTAAALSLSPVKEPMVYKLGKLPARDTVKLTLRDYITPDKLPPLPTGDFGHQGLVKDWLMLGNGPDPSNPSYAPHGVGDCAVCGPYHFEMLANAEGNHPFNVSTERVLEAYADITGYDPRKYDPITGQNPTDQGSSVLDVSEYWRTTGLADADGKVHKIDAYAAIEPGNFEELLIAMYLFCGGVGIGLDFPKEWMDAFARGSSWEKVSNPTSDGGHYVLGTGLVSGYVQVVTWGKLQLMSKAGYEAQNDETYCYLTEENLVNGKDLDGFDLDQLMADMKDLACN